MGSVKDCFSKYQYQPTEYPDRSFTRLERSGDIKDDQCPVVAIGPYIQLPQLDAQHVPLVPIFFKERKPADEYTQVIETLSARNIRLNGKINYGHLKAFAQFVIEFDYHPKKVLFIQDDFYRQSGEIVHLQREANSDRISFNQYSPINPAPDLEDDREPFSNERLKQLLPLLSGEQLANWLEKITKAKVSVFPQRDGFTRSELIKIVAEFIDLPPHIRNKAHLKLWVRLKEENIHRSKDDLSSSRYQHSSGKISLADVAFSNRTILADELFHEIGHAVMEEFKSEFEAFKAISWRGNHRMKDANFISPYAQKNPEEDWAETFANYIANPKKLKSDCPEKYEFFKNKIFQGVEYHDVSHHYFTQSIYQNNQGEMIIDQDAPVLRNPNQSLRLTTTVTTSNGKRVSKVIIYFSGAIDNQKLRSGVIRIYLNGQEIDLDGWPNQEGIFKFEFEIEGEITDLKFEELLIADMAGNIAKHAFPKKTKYQVAKDGQIVFDENSSNQAVYDVPEINPKDYEAHALEKKNLIIIPRPDIQLPGFNYQLILADIDFDPENDTLRLSWSKKDDQSPVFHLFQAKDDQRIAIQSNSDGRYEVLVNFPPRINPGTYRLELINIIKDDQDVDYIPLIKPEVILDESQSVVPDLIYPHEIKMENPTNAGPSKLIQFDLVIPYRENINLVIIQLRYNQEDLSLKLTDPVTENRNGKKVLVFKTIQLPSVSAEVMLREVEVKFNDYVQGSFDPSTSTHMLQAYFKDDRFIIYTSQRIITVDHTLKTE